MQRLGFSPFNSETGFMYSIWPWTPSSPAQPLWVDKRLVPLLGTEMIQVLMLTDHSLAVSLAATLTTFFPSLWYQRVNRGLAH